MNENRREIMENVYLTYLPATKFKTGCLSAQLVTPLRRETAAWNALLPPVLSRGTVRYPDMESLSAAMGSVPFCHRRFCDTRKGKLCSGIRHAAFWRTWRFWS